VERLIPGAAMPVPIKIPTLLTIPEVSVIIGCRQEYVRDWINSGLLPSSKIGDRIFVVKITLDVFLRDNLAIIREAVHDR